MKWNFLHFAAVLIVTGAVTTGCMDEKTQYDYVKLSDVLCSFKANDNLPQTIKVNASEPWRVESKTGWLHIDQTDDTLVITVDDNTTELPRETRIMVASGEATAEIGVKQVAELTSEFTYRLLNSFDMGAVISKKGRYVGGNIKELLPDDSWVNFPVIIDLQSGEWHRFGPFANSLFNIEIPMAISDDGTIFFFDSNTTGCVAVNLDGECFLPKNAEGFKLPPTVQSVSADGRIWIGYGLDNVLAFGGLYHPLKWTDGGVPEVLPVPEKNFRNEPYVAGVMARGMSSDGSVIYGSTWDNLDQGMMYWKDGKVNWVGKDVRKVETIQIEDGLGNTVDYNLVSGMTVTAELTNVSPNGKYIAGTYREEFLDKDIIKSAKYPAFYNTETEKTTIFTDFGEGYGAHVTDEGYGIVLIGTFLPSSGNVVNIEAQSNLGTVKEWVLENYGIIIPMGYINYMTPDGKTFLGSLVEHSALGPRVVNWYVAPTVDK